MHFTTARISKVLIGALALAVGVVGLRAQSLPSGPGWLCTLISGSQLLDDCPICDRVTLPLPLRGTFQFRRLEQGPLFSSYGLDQIQFVAGQSGNRIYKISGQGTYRVGGEAALQQQLFLTLSIDDGFTNEICYFSNLLPNVTRHWPMLQVSLDQTNGSLTRQYHLELDAAPFREIWFSTTNDFQAGIWNAPSNALSNGDLLSSAGRVVRRNHELTARLGILPPVPDLGLKDISILPGGELAFSMNQSVFSETLGVLNRDDLLSVKGRVIARATKDLIDAFVPTAPLPEFVGIGAVQIPDNGPIYFSVESAFGSKALGRTLRPGDLLADNGTLVKSGPELLASFKPVNPTNDFGLRTAFVWASGEIWFSTRDGFYDANSNYFSGGDLLSDQGYVVFRNADLVAAFQPISKGSDFGLDALYLVTDTSESSSSAILSSPTLTNQPPGSLILEAISRGHLFQFLKAPEVSGPYAPLGPITTDSVYLDAGGLSNQVRAYYGLHQW